MIEPLVAELAGRFGWGYDGVDLFASHPKYGWRGTSYPNSEENRWLAGHAAIALGPEHAEARE